MKKAAVFALVLVILGCAGAKEEPRILVQTQERDGGEEPEELTELETLVASDASLAHEILATGIESEDEDLAALCAAYVLRTGLKWEPGPIRRALVKGAGSEDPLISTLSWRWLATGEHGEIPGWKNTSEDPVAAFFAAASHSKDGVPKALAPYLALPDGEPSTGKTPPGNELDRLHIRALPFDDRVLATALLFTDAVRNRWVSPNGEWMAKGLRKDLFSLLELGDVPEEALDKLPGSDAPWPRSKIFSSIANPLTAQPPNMLRSISLSGKPQLRIFALRALVISSTNPVAGDLGAAAAAMRAEEPAVRIEAARTFVILAARAVR